MSAVVAVVRSVKAMQEAALVGVRAAAQFSCKHFSLSKSPYLNINLKQSVHLR